MTHCPCGSTSEYSLCCGVFIDQKQRPTTPELLMRSRYTAYFLKNFNYVKQTMRGKPAQDFDEARTALQHINWIELQIIHTSMQSTTHGFVEFIAYFIEHERLKSIHESSEFICEAGQWFYVNGSHTETGESKPISRNALCPCKSKKKFKNCHGAI